MTGEEIEKKNTVFATELFRKFATINVGIRDYAFIDKYEPVMRVLGGVNDSAEDAKAHADAKLVNNVMFQIGISFWIPTSFEYTTFR